MIKILYLTMLSYCMSKGTFMSSTVHKVLLQIVSVWHYPIIIDEVVLIIALVSLMLFLQSFYANVSLLYNTPDLT